MHLKAGNQKQMAAQNQQQPINSDRPRSLNPQIYPAWWGDDDLLDE